MARWSLCGTKTVKSRRVVPIVGAGVQLLEYALRFAEGEHGVLFRDWGNVRRDLEAACKRAGIAKVSPNDLRRTYATWLRQASVELHLIGAAMATPIRGWGSGFMGRCRSNRLRRPCARASRAVRSQFSRAGLPRPSPPAAPVADA